MWRQTPWKQIKKRADTERIFTTKTITQPLTAMIKNTSDGLYQYKFLKISAKGQKKLEGKKIDGRKVSEMNQKYGEKNTPS